MMSDKGELKDASSALTTKISGHDHKARLDKYAADKVPGHRAFVSIAPSFDTHFPPPCHNGSNGLPDAFAPNYCALAEPRCVSLYARVSADPLAAFRLIKTFALPDPDPVPRGADEQSQGGVSGGSGGTTPTRGGVAAGSAFAPLNAPPEPCNASYANYSVAWLPGRRDDDQDEGFEEEEDKEHLNRGAGWLAVWADIFLVGKRGVGGRRRGWEGEEGVIVP